MIITSYDQCPPNTRIVLTSGRIAHVVSVVPFGSNLLVRLRDATGRTRDITASRTDLALWAPFDIEDLAVASLRERFPDIEFLRSI